MSETTDSLFLGIDIGGTKCSVVVGDRRAGILQKTKIPTNAHLGPDQAIDRILHVARRYRDGDPAGGQAPFGRQIIAAGVSCGGPLDLQRGLILSPPNLPGWDKVPIVDRVGSELGLNVGLLNDADACALAEHRFGAGQGLKHIVFLTFGTGLGAGLILNGQLYQGAGGLAGEVGHIRLSEDGPEGHGKLGSFEGYCSGGGIARLARADVAARLARGETVAFCPDGEAMETLTTKDIVAAAEEGDEVALAVLSTSGEYLGRGLSVLIDTLNPQRIIIGSVFARAKQFLLPAAERVIRMEALVQSAAACSITAPALGEHIGDMAALCVAMYAIGVEPAVGPD